MTDKKSAARLDAQAKLKASIVVRSTEGGRLTSMGGKGTPEQRREAIRRTLERAR